LIHSPTQPREFSSGGFYRITIAEVVIAAVMGAPLGFVEARPEVRLRRLGEEVAAIGSLDQSEFAEWLKCVICARVSSLVGSFESFLQRDGHFPTKWAHELEIHADGLSKSALEQDAAVPREFRSASNDVSDGISKTQNVIKEFGEMLSWWPSVIQATMQLAEDGVTVGASLRERQTIGCSGLSR
jgi:hypothetical protein